MSSATWPPSTAAASALSSSAAPTCTPARWSKCSSPAATPSPRSARPAPSGPRRCGRPNAARAGTWTPNPSSPPTSRTTSSGPGSPTAPTPSRARPGRAAGQDTAELDELTAELDEEITRSGLRGNVLPNDRCGAPLDPAPPGRPRPAPAAGRPAHGRQDLHRAGRQDLPPVHVPHPDLRQLRQGHRDGIPADPDRYDYQRAARDALHFAALFDRLIQNLRRLVGYDLQYFAAVEPQRRLAPHVHVAIRGTVSRAELRQVLAATYHQVWWPPTDQIKHDDAHLPVWHEASGRYLDPETGDFCRLGTRRSTPSARRRAAACGTVRPRVRRPGRPGRITRLGPVHRLPHQVPDQARRRLPPGRPPTRSTRTPSGSPTRCATSRARRPAPTGCATASSPATRAKACAPAAARAKPTAASTSATRAAASWSPASGPARPSPTTAPTARLAPGHPRSFGNRPGPLHLGARHPRRPRPHATRSAAPACRRRPPAMARRAHPGQARASGQTGPDLSATGRAA